jgi:deferrochelatase/peroxidase EfeB
MQKLQDGIYYRKHQLNDSAQDNDSSRNDCFAIVFLHISDSVTSSETVEFLRGLWKVYLNLKKGVVSDLPGQRVPSGGLSVLLGYGPNIFAISGINRKLPRDFKEMQFRDPIGGEPILVGSGINYGVDAPRNLGITEHIMVQFISKSQLATYRAVVETSKYIARISSPKGGITFTTFFTGFQRDDSRSWLGFHDEISNLKNSTERRKAIVIDRVNNDLIHQDFWTAGGTYLAFLRIEIDLRKWEQIKRSDQEILIGRDKLSGVPIVAIDKNGKPIRQPGCPPFSEVRAFDKRFHEHPNYFQRPSGGNSLKTDIDTDNSIRLLSQSHIGRTRHIDQIKSDDPASRRIYRQGFEFIESSYHDFSKPLRMGLNFISYQNDPTRLLFILTDPNWLGDSNFAGTGNIPGMKDLLSVQACGIFFVPPSETYFPGTSIFKSLDAT